MRAVAHALATTSALATLLSACHPAPATRSTPTTFAITTPAGTLGAAPPSVLRVVLVSDVRQASLSLFPRESFLVVGLSLTKLRKSALWSKYRHQIDAWQYKEVGDVHALCGFNPIDTLDTVVFALWKEGAAPSRLAVLAQGSFQETSLTNCALKIFAKAGDELKIDRTGRTSTVYFKNKPGDAAQAVWLNRGSVFGAGSSAARFDELVSGRGVLRENHAAAALLAKTNSADTIWGAFVNEAPKGSGGLLGAVPEGAWWSIEYVDELDARLGLRYADAATATLAKGRLADVIKQGQSNPLANGPLSHVSLATEANDLLASLNLSRTEVLEWVAGVERFVFGWLGP